MNDDYAMTRGQLAARIGVSPNWVTRNVPAWLFKIGGRCHWFSYCDWVAKEIAASSPAAETPMQEVARRFGAPSLSNGRKAALHAPAESPSHDNE